MVTLICVQLKMSLCWTVRSAMMLLTEPSAIWVQLPRTWPVYEKFNLHSFSSLLIPEGLFPHPAILGPNPHPRIGRGTRQWVRDPRSPEGSPGHDGAHVLAHVGLHLQPPSQLSLGFGFVSHCDIGRPGHSCLCCWYINVQFKVETHEGKKRRTFFCRMPVTICTEQWCEALVSLNRCYPVPRTTLTSLDVPAEIRGFSHLRFCSNLEYALLSSIFFIDSWSFFSLMTAEKDFNIWQSPPFFSSRRIYAFIFNHLFSTAKISHV